MAITEEELKEIIEPRADIEEISSISSDGSNLLTRIPKIIVQNAKIQKGQNIRWLFDSKSLELKIELIKNDISQKKNN